VKKILISLGSISSLFLLPFLTLAQTQVQWGFGIGVNSGGSSYGGTGNPNLNGYMGSLITSGTSLLRSVLVFLISLAVVWFIFNVIRYAMSSDEEGKGKAKSQMIWGIIAIAVIVSVWGIVAILQGAFGLNQGASNFSGNLGNMIPVR
jgi:succinate dehydrogenase/fumarate reductase cytochrome b subunit